MNRRIVVSAMAAALSFSATPASHAAMFHRADAQSAPRVNVIKFDLRNDRQHSVVLQAGDQQISLAPGQTKGVRIEDGTALRNVDGGVFVIQVGRMLSGRVVVLN